jgi:glycosyltransferase involved in cell wall biosynthesis
VEVEVQEKPSLRIAYVVQNIGFDVTSEVGIPITVKYTLRGLRKLGHHPTLLHLERERVVTGIDDVSNPEAVWYAPLGSTQTRLYKTLEGGVRHLHGMLRLPYFAFFDSHRFFEACSRCLPAFDLCHEHNGLLSIGAALACVRRRIPYILTMDADPMLELTVLGKPLRGLHRLVAVWETRITYKVAMRIICLSEPAKRHLIENWQVDPEKIAVIPLGVNVDLFAKPYDAKSIRTQLGVYDAPVVMFVGSFQKWHGLDRLAEGFAQILGRVPDARLLLVGDGPARKTIESKVKELGITHAVVFTGLVPHTRVPEMLSVADVVTAPYPRLPQELWFSPLKLYEYMAAGKAIVAAGAGQIADVIKSGHNGILFEPGNGDELAQAAIRLLTDGSERGRLGRNAQQQAIERHSWGRYARQVEEVYFSAMQDRRRYWGWESRRTWRDRCSPR